VSFPRTAAMQRERCSGVRTSTLHGMIVR
jgi:hypothetical protein